METNQVTLTRSSCKIVITLDLDPYDKFILYIPEDASRVEMIVSHSVTKHKSHVGNNPNFHPTIKKV